MILNFRVEGIASDKDALSEQLQQAFLSVAASSGNGQDGSWECTQEVIEKISLRPGYRGRMKFVWHADEADYLDES